MLYLYLSSIEYFHSGNRCLLFSLIPGLQVKSGYEGIDYYDRYFYIGNEWVLWLLIRPESIILKM